MLALTGVMTKLSRPKEGFALKAIKKNWQFPKIQFLKPH